MFPSEIVGKRTRVKTDNTKLTKVYVAPLRCAERSGAGGGRVDDGSSGRSEQWPSAHGSPLAPYAALFAHRFLDRKDQTALEHKLDTFTSVYKNLTGKDVVFEFPAPTSD